MKNWTVKIHNTGATFTFVALDLTCAEAYLDKRGYARGTYTIRQG